jgi:hypothetical protein
LGVTGETHGKSVQEVTLTDQQLVEFEGAHGDWMNLFNFVAQRLNKLPALPNFVQLF